MTWLDLVRKYFPDVTDQAANYILWEKTAFPLASVEHVEKQLQEHQVEIKHCQKENSYI